MYFSRVFFLRGISRPPKNGGGINLWGIETFPSYQWQKLLVEQF